MWYIWTLPCGIKITHNNLWITVRCILKKVSSEAWSLILSLRNLHHLHQPQCPLYIMQISHIWWFTSHFIKSINSTTQQAPNEHPCILWGTVRGTWDSENLKGVVFAYEELQFNGKAHRRNLRRHVEEWERNILLMVRVQVIKANRPVPSGKR